MNYNLRTHQVESFFPHLSDVWDVGMMTPNLITSAGFNFELLGVPIDLTKFPVSHVGYINGTGIIRIEFQAKDLKILAYYWAPMTLEFRVIFLMLHLPDAWTSYGLVPEKVNAYLNANTIDLEQIRLEQYEHDGFWIGQAVIYKQGLTSETCDKLIHQVRGAKPKLLLEAEQRWWSHWHRIQKVPAKIIGKRYDVAEQSAAFLKMAQSREPGLGRGQICRTLSPYATDVASVRDMAYAIVALSRMGHHIEARDALSFMLNAQGGLFEREKHRESVWGLGQPYLISLSHYSGLGQERANYLQGKPLLHLDGQGLFLWALCEYVKFSSDIDFAKQHWNRIKSLVVVPLLGSLDKNGLVRRDSGLWDVSAPGEQFSYTSISTFHGLSMAAVLARTMEDPDAAMFFNQRAVALREQILIKLTVGRTHLIARSLETKKFPFFLDGAAVEAINWGVLNPMWETSRSLGKSLDVFLRVGDFDRGYALGYDEQKQKMPENLFVTLRAIPALRKIGEKKRAERIVDWITNQSAVNGEIIPEFFSADEARYQGAYPMIGQGAGAFLLAILPE